MKKKKKKHPIRVLLTAGPTRAYLDRVRFISNYSTGELGFRLSQALIKKGFEVYAVIGPTQQPFSDLPLKRLIEVETTDEMAKETLKLCRSVKPDFAIFSAAVLDFKPSKQLAGKVSSSKKRWSLELISTPKILDQVTDRYPSIKRIGFKLEWKPMTGQTLSRFAQKLLDQKKLDAVCINFLPQIRKKSHPLWIFTKEGRVSKCKTKAQTAKALADFVNG
ncbi:MAG: phosphopantothenoylcysteine decarboxylase [Pseudomonadota bacterium]